MHNAYYDIHNQYSPFNDYHYHDHYNDYHYHVTSSSHNFLGTKKSEVIKAIPIDDIKDTMQVL